MPWKGKHKLLIDHNTVNNLVMVANLIQWIAVCKKSLSSTKGQELPDELNERQVR